jgi:hypothetical protein
MAYNIVREHFFLTRGENYPLFSLILGAFIGFLKKLIMIIKLRLKTFSYYFLLKTLIINWEISYGNLSLFETGSQYLGWFLHQKGGQLAANQLVSFEK